MKKEKGITLIALIITIIIMLILVGVTVSIALNGGLFKTAKDAATGTDKARIEEEMQGAILAALDNNGNIELNKLKQEIEKIRGIESVGNSFPLTVKDKSGNEWTITSEGEIIVQTPAEPEVEKIISADDPEASYWKTDGKGSIIYYDLPEGVEPPEVLVIPSQIGDEKITKMEELAFYPVKIERYPDSKVIYDGGTSIEDGANIRIIEGEDEYNPTGPTSKVKKVIISKGIEEIGLFAFYMCLNLEEVEIPSTVTLIRNEAFGDCLALKKVMLNEGLKTIGEYAFSRCSELINITIPKGVITVGKGAFGDCTSIKEITIPSTVDNMGAYPFEGWTNTQTIYIKGKTEQPPDSDNDSYSDIGWNANWLEGCNANIVWDK